MSANGNDSTREALPLWKTILGTAAGAVVGGLFSQMLSPETQIQAATGALCGLLVGWLVRKAAIARGEFKLGSAAVISCTASGAMLGLILAVPVGLAFYIVVRRRGGRRPTSDDSTTTGV